MAIPRNASFLEFSSSTQDLQDALLIAAAMTLNPLSTWAYHNILPKPISLPEAESIGILTRATIIIYYPNRDALENKRSSSY